MKVRTCNPKEDIESLVSMLKESLKVNRFEHIRRHKNICSSCGLPNDTLKIIHDVVCSIKETPYQDQE